MKFQENNFIPESFLKWFSKNVFLKKSNEYFCSSKSQSQHGGLYTMLEVEWRENYLFSGLEIAV